MDARRFGGINILGQNGIQTSKVQKSRVETGRGPNKNDSPIIFVTEQLMTSLSKWLNEALNDKHQENDKPSMYSTGSKMQLLLTALMEIH